MKQIVRYAHGDSLSFAEYGDSSGYPILVQHGLIASISDHALFKRLAEAGTRLISIARPGYGDSSPHIMRDIAEWGEIVAVLVETLALSQFDVLGMSSGAPYSYAIGHQLPDKVRNIFIFSGTPALYDPQIAACWPYPMNKQASMDELETLAHDLFFSHLATDDLLRPDIKESMMNHGFGIAQDFKLRCNDWGFKLADVNAFVCMQHSREDTQVPFITAEMTATLLPNCRFEIRETGDHFSEGLLDDFFRTSVIEHYRC